MCLTEKHAKLTALALTDIFKNILFGFSCIYQLIYAAGNV